MPGLGTSLGRGGATTAPQDLRNADAILIMGSSMAENHPVAFRFVVEARPRHTTGVAHLGGATLDDEENYLIKKLFTGGLGLVCLSNQARI